MTFSVTSGLLVAGAVLTGLVTIGFTLNALNKILDSRDREAIRERAEMFWYRTASLELHEQFQLALRSRYSQMRRLQPAFVKLFLAIATVLTLFGAIQHAMSSPTEIKEIQKNLIKSVLNYRYAHFFVIDVPQFDDEPEFGDSDGKCTVGSGFDDLRSVNDLAATKASLAKFLDQNEHNAFAMRLFGFTVSALVGVILTLPLAVGLILSFNLTLWLLSRFTQSRLRAVFIVVVDILLALVMPTIVSGLLLTLMVFAVVFSLEAVPDYTMFGEATWATLTVSSVIRSFNSELELPSDLAALLTKFFVLDRDEQERFLRASYWFQHSGNVFTYSRSASFIALVSAIEAIMPPPTKADACEACNRSMAPGPTKIFVEFVEKMLPGGNIPESDRKRFYGLRSALAHGGKLLQQDHQIWGFSPKEIGEGYDGRRMTLIAQLVLRNWLAMK